MDLALGLAVLAKITPHTVRTCGTACMKSKIRFDMPIHGNASGWRPVRTNFAGGCAPSVGTTEVRVWGVSRAARVPSTPAGPWQRGRYRRAQATRQVPCCLGVSEGPKNNGAITTAPSFPEGGKPYANRPASQRKNAAGRADRHATAAPTHALVIASAGRPASVGSYNPYRRLRYQAASGRARRATVTTFVAPSQAFYYRSTLASPSAHVSLTPDEDASTTVIAIPIAA